MQYLTSSAHALAGARLRVRHCMWLVSYIYIRQITSVCVTSKVASYKYMHMWVWKLTLTYFWLYTFKIKDAVLFPKPSYNYSCTNLIPQSNISCICGKNWRKLLFLTAFCAYIRYLFVTRYNCLCFIGMFAWILLKRSAFCGNNFENNWLIKRNCQLKAQKA